MKFLCKIVLFIFIMFLATPTIISIIDKNVKTSSFYNISEEEKSGNNLSFDEIKLITETISYFVFSFLEMKDITFNLHDDLIICNYKASIFIPPPDLT